MMSKHYRVKVIRIDKYLSQTNFGNNIYVFYMNDPLRIQWLSHVVIAIYVTDKPSFFHQD